MNKLLIIIAESHPTFDMFMRHPANAGIKLSLKIEIMTLPKPVETWSTLATYNFDEPLKQLYEVWGTSLQPKIRGLPLSG